ncbi:MAG: hypothetical protein AABX70_06070 [Nanoarchaeota archaeon]
MELFFLVGAVGLLLVIFGVLSKKRKVQDVYYMCGGLCLLVYSIFIKDWIFVTLQCVFILAAFYDEERVLLFGRIKK